MIEYGYFIFLIIVEIFFYFVTGYYTFLIFTLQIVWHFMIFSIFSFIFFVTEIIFVYDLSIYENNYFEKANIVCHIFNILFIIFYGYHVQKVLKKQQEQCINLLG